MSGKETAFVTALIAGGCAGTSVDVALFPLDTIKTRLQVKLLPWVAAHLIFGIVGIRGSQRNAMLARLSGGEHCIIGKLASSGDVHDDVMALPTIGVRKKSHLVHSNRAGRRETGVNVLHMHVHMRVRRRLEGRRS